MKGKIAIEGPVHFNKIRLGFHENPGYDHSRVRAVWSNKGTVVFQGTAYLGNGTRLRNNGVLTLGHNFQVSGNSFLHCREKMTFGKNVSIGWECVFMDGDGHRIFSMESRQNPGGALNGNRPVDVGDHVWVGAKVMVTKGAKIPSGCVVAANSCIYKVFEEENCVLAGYPAKIVRRDIDWKV